MVAGDIAGGQRCVNDAEPSDRTLRDLARSPHRPSRALVSPEQPRTEAVATAIQSSGRLERANEQDGHVCTPERGGGDATEHQAVCIRTTLKGRRDQVDAFAARESRQI